MSYLWLALAIVAEIAGTLSLRASDGFRRRRWLVPVVLAYVVSFGFLALALATGMPVAAAYAVWSAIGIVLVALLARAIWRDPLTARMMIGIAIITVGVVLVELG
ncbi:DMT family transporter [Gordonia hydrophobica]|uniref:Multidrug efflux SMR transporter n=1 Tax=Gordonia hydrophobica TaxID=40516 RepID=A0ABZ2TZ12_9ACTN|nr:multidrug efflux SMR transporter [Gordonia hydrophobica]MBM7369460.1 small multidrug resistance pump [Gordonia hydrophobica]